MSYKIVPVEPTEKMEKAWSQSDHEETAKADWAVMLSAAPKASEDDELVERVSQSMCRRTNPRCLAYGGPCVNDAICGVHADARAVLKMLEGDGQ